METPKTPVPAVRDSRSLSPVSSPSLSSPSAGGGLSLAGALVAMSVVGLCALALPQALTAFLSESLTTSRKGGYVLLGCLGAAVSVGMSTPSFREFLHFVRKWRGK